MNETNSGLFTATTGTVLGYSGTVSTNLNTPSTMTITGTSTDSGVVLRGNSTINYSSLTVSSNNMRPTQVKVAVFTITRDVDTNEINSTKFLKELWVEQKNGASIDLIVAKHLDKDFDPETTVIKVLSTVSF